MSYEEWVLARCNKLDCCNCELQNYCMELYLSERIINHENSIFEKEVLSGESVKVFAEAAPPFPYGPARRIASICRKVVGAQQK